MDRKPLLFVACLAGFLAAASAHLEPGSLSSPKAGQSHAAGSQVLITWVQAEYHFGRYSLAYSRNGGAWEPIAAWTGPSGDGVTVNYAWTVPGPPGAAIRVRVCQIQNCGEEEYVLVSGEFAVAPAAPVLPAAPAAGVSLRFLAPEGRVQVTFALDGPETVALDAFDSRGVRVAALIDGMHAAGAHVYSLSSRRLRNAESPVFRLRLGNRIFARSGR